MTEYNEGEKEKFRTFVELLKRIAGFDREDDAVISERPTTGQQHEAKSSCEDGYIPAMRAATPSTDREYIRKVLQCSESQLNQFMNNEELKRILLKWGKKIHTGQRSTRPDTPRPPIFSKYNDIVIVASRTRLVSAYIEKMEDIPKTWYKVKPTRNYLSLIRSDTSDNSDDTTEQMKSPESNKKHQIQHETERSTDEGTGCDNTKDIEIESMLSDCTVSVSSITSEETDADSECRQSAIDSLETQFEVNGHISEESKLCNVRRVSFSNDTKVDQENTPDGPAVDDNFKGENEVKIKGPISDAYNHDNVKYTEHRADNADGNEINDKEQWEDRQTESDQCHNLKSYQFQEVKPRMYTSTSQTNPARRNTLDTTKFRAAKNNFLSKRIMSAHSGYGSLKSHDIIRNENKEIQNRLENALPVIDTWNRIRVVSKPTNQMGDTQSRVLDPFKYGSVVHFQQVRQENVKNQLRLHKARSKVCSWQSGQIMSLLTAGQARKIKAKRKLN